jgi:hypothetical protein
MPWDGYALAPIVLVVRLELCEGRNCLFTTINSSHKCGAQSTLDLASHKHTLRNDTGAWAGAAHQQRIFVHIRIMHQRIETDCISAIRTEKGRPKKGDRLTPPVIYL